MSEATVMKECAPTRVNLGHEAVQRAIQGELVGNAVGPLVRIRFVNHFTFGVTVWTINPVTNILQPTPLPATGRRVISLHQGTPIEIYAQPGGAFITAFLAPAPPDTRHPHQHRPAWEMMTPAIVFTWRNSGKFELGFAAPKELLVSAD